MSRYRYEHRNLPTMIAARAERPTSGIVVGLDDLADGWDELAGPDASPMQRLAWAAAMDPAMVVRGPPMVNLVVGDPRSPDALAPLRPGGGRLREFSLSAYGEPIDFLYRDRAALAQLCEAVADLRAPIKLHRLPADSPTREAFVHAYERRGVVHTRQLTPCPVLRLDRSWLEPEGRFNPRRRSDIRRYQRRAKAIGGVEIEFLAPRPPEVAPLMTEAIAVETSGWKGRAGTALARDRELRLFFLRWAELAAREGILRMAFLRIGGRPAAMQIAAETGRRLWLLKIGYNERFARCAPGFLLMLEVVRTAADRNLERIELLGQRETWTALWSTEERAMVRLAAYPTNITGSLAMTRDVIVRSRILVDPLRPTTLRNRRINSAQRK